MSDPRLEKAPREGIAVLVPCYKRPEYTKLCIEALEKAQDYKNTLFYLVNDGSPDETKDILDKAKFKWKHVHSNPNPSGLRNVIIHFFQLAQNFKYIVKVDNDCAVPKNWLTRITTLLDSGHVDILSPNVHPSNAAFTYGSEDKEGRGFRPSKTVGGLWAMRADLIEDIHFEPFSVNGIRGAFQLLNQIIVEKEPRVGWVPDVIVEDLGHHSGAHPDHIKSQEHLEYSVEVGRKISWA